MTQILSRRDAIMIATCSLAVARACTAVADSAVPDASTEAVPYEEPDALAKLPFGTRSHWLQPWRICNTVAAPVLARGVGAVFENVELPTIPQAIETLSENGLRTVRIEIGWGEVDYETESQFRNEDSIRRVLLACRRTDVRPLILLNAHHARPAPAKLGEAHLAEPVTLGERSVVVEPTADIVPGRTGISNLTDKVMAEVMVTRVEGPRLYLSKPMPVTLPAGHKLQLATLRYEPFSKPGTPRNEATLAGWLRYVDLVADLAGTILRSFDPSDRGFDLEIWNELTFGSKFLSLGNYYDPLPEEARSAEGAIWGDLAWRTAAHAAADSGRRYQGVVITNGFANTIPWIASSQQHARISAISKHPYPPVVSFPKDAQKQNTALGPDGQPTDFEPSYAAYFPEFRATAIQTETLLRDIAPGPNSIYGLAHGRMARSIDGKPTPVDVWLTEMGASPRELGVTDRRAADRLKVKFCLRSALFFFGIGATRVYLFNAIGDPGGHALIDAATPTVSTPPLQALARGLAMICGPEQASDLNAPLRPLYFQVYPTSDDTNPIFTGGGNPMMPPLIGSDCLVLMPFQSAAGRWAIVYYVMTRDIRTDRPPEQLRIVVAGVDGNAVEVQTFDPETNRPARFAVQHRETNRLTLEIEASDVPRVLVLHENSTTMSR
jgi:hypothetical protein